MYLLYYLRDLLQLVIAPRKGWEDISADGFEVKTLFTKGFIPLISITALTVLVKWFYIADISVVALIQQTIVCFLKFFATYFIAGFLFTIYLPGCVDGEFSLTKCNIFILFGLGLIAIIDLIINVLPMDVAVAYIMPVYVMFIMWRGLRYMNIDFEGVGTFILLIIFALIIPPFALQYLFNLVIPSY